MRRSWPKARAYIISAGWSPVEVPLGRRGRTITLFNDPLFPDRDPVYLHKAESRQDWRAYVVRSVITM